jgi:hypothetical protein
MFGTGNFTRSGTSNRTAGALMVGAGGSRTGAGSLSRVYNWCHSNSTDVLACTLGGGGTSLVSWVAGSYTLLYGSRDGTTWELCTTQPFPSVVSSSVDTYVSSIVYGNNVWVAGCFAENTDKGVATISHSLTYSYDGMNWKTIENDPFTGTKLNSVGCFSIAFADGWFVAAGASQGGTILAYSRDGMQWSSSTFGKGGDSNSVGRSIVYAGGTWLLTYSIYVDVDIGSHYVNIYTSYSNQPSSSWSTPPLLQDFDLKKDIFFVSVLQTKTVGDYSWFNRDVDVVYQTNDLGETFQPVSGLPQGKNTYFSNIASGKIGNETTNTLACFVQSTGSSKEVYSYLYTSTSGSDWNKNESYVITGVINCLLYGNNLWVAGGEEGLFYSEDGMVWNPTNITDSKIFEIIAFNGKQWQAYNYNSYSGTSIIYYSQNGKDWVKSSTRMNQIITMQSNLPGTILAQSQTT